MIIIKVILLMVIIGLFIYGLTVMLPMKISLAKKYGLDKNNQDLINIAKSGNEELMRFYKKSKLFLLFSVISGVALVIIHQITRG